MKNILKEPLLHFILAGGALFLLFGAMGNNDEGDYTIVVDDSDIDLLINRWETQWKRYPSQDELQFLFDKFLQEEVYYREALNMSLDHNDEIIRRRMAQKMEFLTKDLAEMTEPGDEALLSFYNKNIDKYSLSPRVSLAQVYFSNDSRDDPSGDAASILEEVIGRTPDPDFIEEVGDKISLPSFFEDRDRTYLVRQMGNEFADAVLGNEDLGWIDRPVVSGYGLHLVYVFDIVPGGVSDFEDVKQKVQQDYKYALSLEYNASMFRSLVDKYDVILDFNEYNALQNKLNVENADQD